MRHTVGAGEKLSERVDSKILKWFGHMERMNAERLTKRVHDSELEGRRERGRPCTMWLDGVKNACNATSLELRDSMVK